MTLRFIDSFSHYTIPDQLNQKYSAYYGGVPMTGRRTGSTALRTYSSSDYISLTLDDQSTWIVGFAFYMFSSTSNNCKILQLLDSSGTVQLTINIASGIIKLYRGDLSTLLATATPVIPASVWNYIETKMTIADSNGLFELRVNEQVVISYTGDTKYSSTLATARTIKLAASGYVYIGFQDLYICDGTGSANNDYLGDVRIDALLPVGAGASTQFTPTGNSTNWSNVSDATNDGDTTYNFGDTAGLIDTFDCTNLSSTNSTIYGVQLNLSARKDDAGSRTLRGITRINSTNHESADMPLSTSYVDCRQIMELNPSTSAAWTEATINAAEFGYKVQA